MRVSVYSVLGLRLPELDALTLTERERATLRSAAGILDRVREQRNSRVPTDWYAGEEDDCDLVFGWRICDALATDGRIDASTVR